MRDEGGNLVADDQISIISGQEDTLAGSVLSGEVSQYSPSIAVDKESGAGTLSLPSPPPATSPAGLPPTVNPSLAPGTVSGISTSATDAATPVDWELWQQIVNHGPQALNGSNSEELNAAIRRGIPQTIRGVIWQVLADSRNLDLEEVYRDLLARGTDKERDCQWNVNSATTVNGHSNGSPKDKEKESLASSRSSVRSDNSTPATSANLGVMPPASQQEKDGETLSKAQAASEAVRKKKTREDAAALQKLEKAIRRDLGSRTSYSKYFLSQRNQDGLFGLCKAYALYDEAVGYAQGMTFIVMPLLFNVGVLVSAEGICSG
jgi:hypothetical protein